ncbi:carbohydrate kinase family protein [Lunatibacter salilacus]|uniref:carbohydrate kinase family protein n=1 Tax=Lunatibacter salilacus TaxID=2483804 RepID=UPI00131AB343|nr:carbohydrate kinase [Lunatibacter salilacus]
MTKKVICFGEMLWDIFPKGKIAGGAPMNVALHLRHLGLDVSMISRVGEDKLGKKLLKFVRNYHLNQELIQLDTDLPTGTVLVNDSDPENIRYEIVKPAAWDNIQWNEATALQVKRADALVFGSLAARETTSREALFKFLSLDILKILDINLRQPYYSPELLEQLLLKCDILKINEEELTILANYYNLPDKMSQALGKLTELFDIQMICVTLGAKGAILFTDDEIVSHPGYPVAVVDTVGSGDAFLAGFIYKYLEKQSPEHILDYACALGALVATLSGGTPKYELDEIEKIKKE